MKTKEIIGCISGLIVLIGLCFGVYFFFENRYALAEELKKTQQRLEEKIQSDRLNSVQERIWKIQDRIGNKKPNDNEKEEIRRLKEEKDRIDKSLKKPIS